MVTPGAYGVQPCLFLSPGSSTPCQGAAGWTGSQGWQQGRTPTHSSADPWHPSKRIRAGLRVVTWVSWEPRSRVHSDEAGLRAPAQLHRALSHLALAQQAAARGAEQPFSPALEAEGLQSFWVHLRPGHQREDNSEQVICSMPQGSLNLIYWKGLAFFLSILTYFGGGGGEILEYKWIRQSWFNLCYNFALFNTAPFSYD